MAIRGGYKKPTPKEKEASKQKGSEKIREALQKGSKSDGTIGDIGGGTGERVSSSGGGSGGGSSSSSSSSASSSQKTTTSSTTSTVTQNNNQSLREAQLRNEQRNIAQQKVGVVQRTTVNPVTGDVTYHGPKGTYTFPKEGTTFSGSSRYGGIPSQEQPYNPSEKALYVKEGGVVRRYSQEQFKSKYEQEQAARIQQTGSKAGYNVSFQGGQIFFQERDPYVYETGSLGTTRQPGRGNVAIDLMIPSSKKRYSSLTKEERMAYNTQILNTQMSSKDVYGYSLQPRIYDRSNTSISSNSKLLAMGGTSTIEEYKPSIEEKAKRYVKESQGSFSGILAGVGLTAYSYGKGTVTGFLNFFNPKTYSDLYKTVTNPKETRQQLYQLGPAIYENPLLGAEIAGQFKGFGFAQKFTIRGFQSISKLSSRYVPFKQSGVKVVEGVTTPTSRSKLLSYEGKTVPSVHATMQPGLKPGVDIKPAAMENLAGWRKALGQRSFYTSSPAKASIEIAKYGRYNLPKQSFLQRLTGRSTQAYQATTFQRAGLSTRYQPVVYGGYIDIGEGYSGSEVKYTLLPNRRAFIFRDTYVSKTPSYIKSGSARSIIAYQTTKAGTYIPGENIKGLSIEGQFTTSPGLEGESLMRITSKQGPLSNKFTYYQQTQPAPGFLGRSKLGSGIWNFLTSQEKRISFQEVGFEQTNPSTNQITSGNLLSGTFRYQGKNIPYPRGDLTNWVSRYGQGALQKAYTTPKFQNYLRLKTGNSITPSSPSTSYKSISEHFKLFSIPSFSSPSRSIAKSFSFQQSSKRYSSFFSSRSLSLDSSSLVSSILSKSSGFSSSKSSSVSSRVSSSYGFSSGFSSLSSSMSELQSSFSSSSFGSSGGSSSGYSDFLPSPPKPPSISPTYRSKGKKKKSKVKREKIKRPYQYQPSLVGKSFNIKKQDYKLLTGLEIRGV